MKGFILLTLFALPSFADQSVVLGVARDQQVVRLTKLLNEYCENNYPDILKEKDALLLCHLQLEADCDNAESKLKSFACDLKGEARYFERNAVKSQALLRDQKKDFIGSQLERLRDPCKFDKSLPECNIVLTPAGKNSPPP